MWKCYSLFTAQNDFIDGSLKVDGAVDIVNPIGQIIENEELWGQVKKKRLGLFAIPFFVWEQLDLTKVVYSADWHPQNHISFFSNLQSRWSKWFQNKQLRTDWHISPEPSILSGVRAILAKSRCSTRFRKFHNPSRDDSRLCLRLLPQTDPSLTSKHSGLTIASKSLKVIDEECDLRLFPHPQEQSSTKTYLHLPGCWKREPTLRFVSITLINFVGPNFPRQQYFPQVDSYSAFYDNTGKEGAGSTGLADQIAGTTEVLQWMFFWQIFWRKKQIVSTYLLNTYILPTLCCINSTFCRWCWSGLPPTTALATPPCTRLKRSVGDQSEPSSKICFWQVWGQYIIHWVTG